MNGKKTIQLGDVIRFTPRHERHLGTVVEAVVTKVSHFAHATGASHFEAVAGRNRYWFPLFGHNGQILKGRFENVEKAERLYLLLLHKAHGGVWTERHKAFCA